MKFILPAIVSAVFFGSTLAQRIVIGSPPDGTAVKAGTNLTVEVDRPNSLSGSTEVAVVLGLTSCSNTPCRPPTDILGTILYNGPYNPQLLVTGPPFKPPHQNISVTIPAGFPTGPAQLNVVHVSLIGAGPAPFLETLNITLNVQ